MSGNKCSYLGCGKSSRTNRGVRKFRFPVTNQALCTTWMINSGNQEHLPLKIDEWKSKFLCGDHFSDNCLTQKKLPYDAIPHKYPDTENFILKDNVKQYSNRSQKTESKWDIVAVETKASTSNSPNSFKEDEEMQDSTSEFEEKIEIIVEDIGATTSSFGEEKLFAPKTEDTQNRLNLATHARKLEFQRKRQLQSKITSTKCLKHLSLFARTLTQIQLFHIPRTGWTKQEKEVALCIYRKSPPFYRFLRQKGFILPSIGAIKLWLSHSNPDSHSIFIIKKNTTVPYT